MTSPLRGCYVQGTPTSRSAHTHWFDGARRNGWSLGEVVTPRHGFDAVRFAVPCDMRLTALCSRDTRSKLTRGNVYSTQRGLRIPALHLPQST